MTATFDDWCTHYDYEPTDPKAQADYQRYLAGLDVFAPQTQPEAKLDWLALRIIDVVGKLDDSQIPWLRDKLAGRNRMQAFQFINNLDRSSRAAIAAELGVNPERFEIALDVSRSL